MTRYLQEYAGENPAIDRKYTGYIAAVNDLLNITVEETQRND